MNKVEILDPNHSTMCTANHETETHLFSSERDPRILVKLPRMFLHGRITLSTVYGRTSISINRMEGKTETLPWKIFRKPDSDTLTIAHTIKRDSKDRRWKEAIAQMFSDIKAPKVWIPPPREEPWPHTPTPTPFINRAARRRRNRLRRKANNQLGRPRVLTRIIPRTYINPPPYHSIRNNRVVPSATIRDRRPINRRTTPHDQPLSHYKREDYRRHPTPHPRTGRMLKWSRPQRRWLNWEQLTRLQREGNRKPTAAEERRKQYRRSSEREYHATQNQHFIHQDPPSSPREEPPSPEYITLRKPEEGEAEKEKYTNLKQTKLDSNELIQQHKEIHNPTYEDITSDSDSEENEDLIGDYILRKHKTLDNLTKINSNPYPPRPPPPTTLPLTKSNLQKFQKQQKDATPCNYCQSIHHSEANCMIKNYFQDQNSLQRYEGKEISSSRKRTFPQTTENSQIPPPKSNKIN